MFAGLPNQSPQLTMNRLSINSNIGKVIPKWDNKWEKGKLICIGASKVMSELIRMVRAIASGMC